MICSLQNHIKVSLQNDCYAKNETFEIIDDILFFSEIFKLQVEKFHSCSSSSSSAGKRIPTQTSDSLIENPVRMDFDLLILGKAQASFFHRTTYMYTDRERERKKNTSHKNSSAFPKENLENEKV